MARRKLDKPNVTLEELVEVWGTNKTTADGLKKIVEKDAAQIKEIMLSEKLTESKSGKYTAKLSIQHKEKFNEDGLLEYIKTKLWGDKGSMECPYIKRVEVIDWDALESAIYNEKITKAQLIEIDKFRETIETPVLKLTVDKEDK